jgi:hypothetical protein
MDINTPPCEDGETITEGWLVCPTCEGDGTIAIGEWSLAIECPDCNGTGDPPFTVEFVDELEEPFEDHSLPGYDATDD